MHGNVNCRGYQALRPADLLQAHNMMPSYPHHLLSASGHYTYPDGIMHYPTSFPSYRPPLSHVDHALSRATSALAWDPNAAISSRVASTDLGTNTFDASHHGHKLYKTAADPPPQHTLFRPKASRAVRSGSGLEHASSLAGSRQTGGSGQSSQSALQLLEAIRQV